MATTFGELYRDFEDAFRGSPELIGERQRVYLKLLESVPQSIRSLTAIDIGAGRGEWLKELRRNGWSDLLGVEPDLGMGRDIVEAGIPLRVEDGLNCLKTYADSSACIVTAFHVIEHVRIDYLVAMLSEMVRVLAPGGVLILETPNPESIRVGTWSFLVDPTHVSPIPPPLLEFLVSRLGLPDSAVARLNGVPADPAAPASRRIVDLMFMTGLDYAVVAQKASGMAGTTSAVAAFARDFGQPSPADYPALAAHFSDFENRSNELGLRIDELGRRMEAVDRTQTERIEGVAGALPTLAERVGRLEANPAVHLGQLHLRGAALRAMARNLATLPGRLARRVYRPVMLGGIRFVASRPALHGSVVRLLSRVAPVDNYLRRFAAAHKRDGAGEAIPARPTDPNAPYLFNPGKPGDGQDGPVTVEQLYHMSRSLEDRP